jgi:hypothetical protein
MIGDLQFATIKFFLPNGPFALAQDEKGRKVLIRMYDGCAGWNETTGRFIRGTSQKRLESGDRVLVLVKETHLGFCSARWCLASELTTTHAVSTWYDGLDFSPYHGGTLVITAFDEDGVSCGRWAVGINSATIEHDRLIIEALWTVSWSEADASWRPADEEYSGSIPLIDTGVSHDGNGVLTLTEWSNAPRTHMTYTFYASAHSIVEKDELARMTI